MGKTVPESKFTELKGLDRISTVVHAMNCLWREISKDDFGIDAEIEVVTPKSDFDLTSRLRDLNLSWLVFGRSHRGMLLSFSC